MPRRRGLGAASCDALAWDIDDLAADPELGTVDGRLARAAEIDERVRRWCATRHRRRRRRRRSRPTACRPARSTTPAT